MFFKFKVSFMSAYSILTNFDIKPHSHGAKVLGQWQCCSVEGVKKHGGVERVSSGGGEKML